MNAFAIIANGPFPDKSIINEAIQHKIIIALDGAANKLIELKIKPDVILGDFDSLNDETLIYWGITQTFSDISADSKPYLGKQDVLIVPCKDQSETDLVKAIHYCDLQQAESITILCATGGREDHHEGTKRALQSEYRSDRIIVVHSEQQSLRYGRDETIELAGIVGDYCGIIAIHTGQCSSTGLEYECNGHDFSICNRLKTTPATVKIHGSALIIMPPQLKSQRPFVD